MILQQSTSFHLNWCFPCLSLQKCSNIFIEQMVVFASASSFQSTFDHFYDDNTDDDDANVDVVDEHCLKCNFLDTDFLLFLLLLFCFNLKTMTISSNNSNSHSPIVMPFD